MNALERKPLPIYGNGSNIRDWLYVEDHVRALHLIAVKGRAGEKYNIGGANERSNIQVVQRICELMDRLSPCGAAHERLITFVDDRPATTIATRSTRRRSGTSLAGARRRHNQKTVRCYLDRRDWWAPLRDGVYRGERLGLLGTQ